MNNSQTLRPDHVVRERIDPLEIARYYLEISLAKVRGDDPPLAIQQWVSEMDEETIWRLTEAFSVTIALNDVFRFLTNESYSWSQEVWPIGALRLTGINPNIDKVVQSETVDRHPLALRDYLMKYFEKHPADDPEHLGELRPHRQPIRYSIIFLREYEGRPAILDGSHRLVEMALQGETTMMAYIGRGDAHGRSRQGPSIFRTLRLAYERRPDDAVLTTVRHLLEQSTDGRQWVQIYWIDHVQDEAIRQKGRELLS